ncbi:MAG: ankyrin repeat domain-containing protein [Sulfurimonadaceae bacterium]
MKQQNNSFIKDILMTYVPLILIFFLSTPILIADVIDASRQDFNSSETFMSLINAKNFNVNKQNNYGQTLLHIASKKGLYPIVKTLIEKGADVNLVDTLNRTPLHYAILQQHYEIAKYLIKHGTDVSIADQEGNTPLYIYLNQIEDTKVKVEMDSNLYILLIDK